MPSMVLPMELSMTAVGEPEVFTDFRQGQFPVNGTFSRDSTVNGWTLDANGDPVLTEFAIDEPAFVIDPATGQRLGYRALAGFTNSLLDNRDLSTGNWTQVSSADLTIAQDAVGMDGVANSAHTITDTDASGNNRIVQSVSVPDDSDTHAVVFPVRKDSDESRFPEFRVELTGGTTVEHRIMVNTATGEKNEQRTDGTGAVEDWGEWWGVSVAIPNNGSGNTALSYEIWPARTDTFGSYSATSGSIVYDFGGVYLNSSIAGPPIETEGSPVSTAADVANEPLGNAFNPQAHTIVVRGLRFSQLNVTGNRIVRVHESGNEGNYAFYIWQTSGDVIELASADGTSLSSSVAPEIDTPFNIAASIDYSTGTMGIAVNGVADSQSTADSPPADDAVLQILHREAASDFLNGTVQEVHMHKYAMNEAELQAATS